jgi:O-antigen ligase
MGGGSRADIISLIILRPLSAITLVWFALTLKPEAWREIRIPLVLLGFAALLAILQLVPLPPALWHSLPGRSLISQEDVLVGFGDIWRPISLNPDGTLNALYSLFVPFSILLGFAGLDASGRRIVPQVLLALVAISILLSILQITGGQNSKSYLYAITNFGMMVGLFANRNHNALFIACALPLLALLARKWVQSVHGMRSPKVMIGSVAAIGVLPVLAVVGSRIALVAGLAGFIFAGYLFLRGNDRLAKPLRRYRKWVVVGAAALIVIITSVVLTFGNAAQRIGAMDVSEIRFAIWHASWAVMAHYFPVGSGFGSFDAVYRAGEPLSTIGPSYINHAHNDFLEIAIEGGLPGLVLLAAAIGCLAVRVVKITRSRPHVKSTALAGLAIIVILLIGSTTDYPLRVPSLMALLAIASAWVWDAHVQTRAAWR